MSGARSGALIIILLLLAPIVGGLALPPDERPEGFPVGQIVLPMGDMDGDGLDDVMLLEIFQPRQSGGGLRWAELSALRGHDGFTLWHLEFDDIHDFSQLAVHRVADVDGDGRDDLLVVRSLGPVLRGGVSAWPGACLPEELMLPFACVVAGVGLQLYELHVLSAKTGKTIWWRMLVLAGAGAAAGTSDHAAGAAFMTPHAMGITLADVTGDGVTDIIINTLSRQFDTTGWSYQRHGQVLDGRNGLTWLVRSSAWTGWWGGGLVPAGDLDGDGVEDLVWHVPDDDRRLHLEALRGGARELLWRATHGDGVSPFLVAPRVDLDGDGLADVLIQTMQLLVAVSGADGDALWTRRPDHVFGAAKIEGRTGFDLLLSRNAWDLVVSVTRVSGADGADLFTTHQQWTRPEGCVGLWGIYTRTPTVVGDVDGDGVPDIRFPIHGGCQRSENAHEVIESSVTGERLFERRSEMGGRLYAEVDFDGDGRANILDTVWSWEGQRVSLHRSTGELVWSEVGSPLQTWRPGTATILGDIDGDGHPDVAVFGRGPDEQSRYPLDVRSGSTGELLWTSYR